MSSIEIEIINGIPQPKGMIKFMTTIGEIIIKLSDEERKRPVDQAIADNNILFSMGWFD